MHVRVSLASPNLTLKSLCYYGSIKNCLLMNFIQHFQNFPADWMSPPPPFWRKYHFRPLRQSKPPPPQLLYPCLSVDRILRLGTGWEPIPKRGSKTLPRPRYWIYSANNLGDICQFENVCALFKRRVAGFAFSKDIHFPEYTHSKKCTWALTPSN